MAGKRSKQPAAQNRGGQRNWKTLLKADPTDWLLEKDNPSVRYLALTCLLDRPCDAPDVSEARSDIMVKGVVPQILARQGGDGAWEKADRFYTAKYAGTVWQLIILAELEADGRDKRIRMACDYILENSQDRQSHGFSIHRSVKTDGGRHSEVIPCLTGNIVFSLIKLGYLENTDVRHAINWITRYQRFDDAEDRPPEGWPYDKLEMCWGRHTCHMGAIKALKALAEIPENERSPDVRRVLEAGAEFFLKHHVHKRSHNLTRVSKPGWLRFGFPLMYHTDILEVLTILTRLGCRDDRMRDAMDLVVSKQDAQGRWELASSFNGRFQADIEKKAAPSKWITLRALTVLKRYYG